MRRARGSANGDDVSRGRKNAVQALRSRREAGVLDANIQAVCDLTELMENTNIPPVVSSSICDVGEDELTPIDKQNALKFPCRKSSPPKSSRVAHRTLSNYVYDHSDNMGAARLRGALPAKVPVRRGRIRAHLPASQAPARRCERRPRRGAS